MAIDDGLNRWTIMNPAWLNRDLSLITTPSKDVHAAAEVDSVGIDWA